MSDFASAALAMKVACPNNEMLTDDKGMPSFYVKLAAQPLSALLTDGDSSIHPAFLVNGQQKDHFLCGKFQGVANNNRIYSLPGEDPRANITLDTYESYCKNKGPGHHCHTAAEWAFIALWCKKNGTQPKGNNNYGKDTTETTYVAIPSMAKDAEGRTQRVATGTGPVTWSHNGQRDGIWDLNGNVWEWTAGIRLVYGELQVIPYNNAAHSDTATGASSTEWKALNASATGYNDLYITPNGSGTTSGSVKLDYVSSHWQWQAAAITSQSDSSRNATFASTTASGLSDFCKMHLRAMALLPEDGDTDYGGDYFYGNNGAAERCAYRGGSWNYGAYAGVFYLIFSSPRSHSYGGLGGRPAFIEETDN